MQLKFYFGPELHRGGGNSLKTVGKLICQGFLTEHSKKIFGIKSGSFPGEKIHRFDLIFMILNFCLMMLAKIEFDRT
ncbi:MAG: hypothetical protein C5B52_12125 [Bacteroidetes bacterium]|nr:MAG: hypothetical protein C5B52_12125 [Bacteroidota bacterium]